MQLTYSGAGAFSVPGGEATFVSRAAQECEKAAALGSWAAGECSGGGSNSESAEAAAVTQSGSQ